MTALELAFLTEANEPSREARALDVFTRHSAGETLVSIAGDYDISASRAADIYHQERRRRNLPERWSWPKSLKNWRSMELKALPGLPSKILQVLLAAGLTTFGSLERISDIDLIANTPGLKKMDVRRVRKHISLIKVMGGD